MPNRCSQTSQNTSGRSSVGGALKMVWQWRGELKTGMATKDTRITSNLRK